MKLKRLKKTQYRILELALNQPHFVSEVKKGNVRFSMVDDNIQMSIQGNRLIEESLKLSNNFPEVFRSNLVSFSLNRLTVINKEKAIELYNYNNKG